MNRALEVGVDQRHYVLNAAKHPRRWVAFSPGRIAEFRASFGDDFCLVVVGDPTLSSDFYAIPWGEVTEYFVEGNRYAAPRKGGGTNFRWQMHLEGPPHHFQLELAREDGRSRPRLDASRWYANASALARPAPVAAASPPRPQPTSPPLFERAVYTIVDVDVLLAADRGAEVSAQIIERKPWTTAEKMLVEARRRGEIVPLLIADARAVHRWLGWAELVTAVPFEDDKGPFTKFTFRSLRTPLAQARSELVLESTARPLSDAHVRPYVILRTPDFLRDIARADAGPPLTDWLRTEEAALEAFDANNDDENRSAAIRVFQRAINIARREAAREWRVVVTPGRIRLVVRGTTFFDVGEVPGRHEFWAGLPALAPEDEDLTLEAVFAKYETRFRAHVGVGSGGPGTALPHSEEAVRFLDAQAVSSQALTSAAEPEVLSEDDSRQRVVAEVARRQGQGAFRDELLRAWRGACALTGCSVAAVLEAAHLLPYRGGHTNDPINGILLRADVHQLLDLVLVGIDAETSRVTLDDSLRDTAYADLAGATVRWPDGEDVAARRAILDERARRGASRRPR